MYVLIEQVPEFSRLNERCKALVEAIISRTKIKRESITIFANQNVYSVAARAGKMFLLRDGCFACSREGKVFLFVDEGDVIGFTNYLVGVETHISSEFGVKVEEFSAEDFFRLVSSNEELSRMWLEYLACQLQIHQLIMSSLIEDDMVASPRIRNVSAGEVLITEGTSADEVFTLLEGHADVIVSGIKVGEILRDEIFGALAALTNTPRTATVKATKESMVLSLPKDNFIQLIKSRPTTVLKMVEDMARTIVALNSQVVSSKLSKI